MAVLLGAACQASSPRLDEGSLQVTPAAVAVAPGGQVQFTAQSPWGSDVSWSVSLASCGGITSMGLFTASLARTDPSGLCTVVATLKSDPARVGLAVVVVQVEPPVTAVAASGQRQSADGVTVDSVVAEPVNSVIARDSTGWVENRSGFHPSGSATP